MTSITLPKVFCNLDDLPESIILLIFKFIDHRSLCLGVRLVNTKFCRITRDGALWRNVFIPHYFTDRRFLLLVKQIACHVKYLACFDCDQLTANAFSSLSNVHFPHLLYISVPVSNSFDYLVFKILARNCPRLQEIENITIIEENIIVLQSLFNNLKCIHDKPTVQFGYRMPNPCESLGIDIWLESLSNIQKRCPSISEYKCFRCQKLADGRLQELALLFPKLSTLELRECYISDEALKLFFMFINYTLEKIILDHTSDITDYGIKLIADKCPNLKVLEIHPWNQKITYNGLKYVVSKLTNLKSLCIILKEGANHGCYDAENSFLKDDILKNIGSSMKQLNEIEIYHSQNFTRSGIEYLVNGCVYLKKIVLSKCSHIDDNCLILLSNLKFLCMVSLVSCTNVSPKGFIEFILSSHSLHTCVFYTLSKEFLSFIDSFPDSVLVKIENGIIPHTSMIKRLTLQGIGGELLRLITSLCPLLQSLDLGNSVAANEADLISIFRNCECLEKIVINFDAKLKDNFIFEMIVHAKNLKLINLGTAGKEISFSAMDQCLAKCPSLSCVLIDIKISSLDENKLVQAAKEYHGGVCYFKVLSDEYSDTRYIEIHFTPLKYISSTTLKSCDSKHL